MKNKIEKWDKEVHFYDKLNGHDLEEHIVKKRLKSGLKSTICVYMMYEVYENLTKHNSSSKKDCYECGKEIKGVNEIWVGTYHFHTECYKRSPY